MAAVATNRVVAEFYYGIDFPSDWADKPTTMITAGLAHERVASVIVLLDADERPLAACWQLDGCDEKFVRIDPDAGDQDDLLSELDDDLAYQSRRDTGHSELYATLLWEPNEVPLALGTVVHRIVFMHGRYMSEWGWNVATRDLVAKAPGLVLVTRSNSTGLALPVPVDTDAMHREMGDDAETTYVVLPASPSLDGK